MQYKKFGSHSFQVSILGFGAMRLPMKKVLFWWKVKISEAIRILRYAIDNGINYVDTAWGYNLGKSEVVVGKALQDGYRTKVYIATKLPLWFVNKPEDFDYFLNKQLHRLKTEYIDFYLFHDLNKNRFKQVQDLRLLKKMEEARNSGLIKYIGFSFHDTFPVFKEIIDAYSWDMAQVQYNYLDTEIQATTAGLMYAASKGIPIVVMEPIKGGELAQPIPEVQNIFDISPYRRTAVDWALQFVWNRPEIICALSGMGSLKMLQENIMSANTSRMQLKPTELTTIEAAIKVYKKKILIPCSACKYCQPCPNGVKIHHIFAIMNKLSKFGNRKQADSSFEYFLRRNWGPDRCTNCKRCINFCPQKINIPIELKKVSRVIYGESIDYVYKI